MSAWSGEIDRLVQKAKVEGGLVVQLGSTETLASGLGSRVLVHGLDTDSGRIASTRKAIMAKGLYGPLSVTTYDGKTLPYAENMVNLLIVNNASQVSHDEMMLDEVGLLGCARVERLLLLGATPVLHTWF